MAITEQDYLILRDLNKAKTWMLLRSERQFLLVRVDASLTEQKYERLMKRYPCGLKTFHELGIPVTPLDREKCTHVILEGTGEGERLTLYCSGNVRTYTLGDSYSPERLSDFFAGQQVQWRSLPQPKGPDVCTTQAIGWSLNIGAFGLLLVNVFFTHALGILSVILSMVLFAASVALCALWPGRFAIGAMKGEDRLGAARYRVDMELALIFPLLLLVVDSMRVTYEELLPLILGGAVLGLGIGILLIWTSRGYRSILAGAVGLTLALMLLSDKFHP